MWGLAFRARKVDDGGWGIDHVNLLAESIAAFDAHPAGSAKQLMRPAPVDLYGVVTRASGGIKGVAGERVQVRMMVGKDKVTVVVDPAHIERTLVDVATTMTDAMPEGGALILKTGTAPVKGSFTDGNGWGCAYISLSDAGPPIRDTTRPQALPAPVKKGKEGSLGLSVVREIVGQHHGTIRASSEHGKGVTFTLYLPVLSGTNGSEGHRCARAEAGQ